MGLGHSARIAPGVAEHPAIPESGLHEVLAAWSGQGQLVEALAAIESDLTERRWTAADITRRANRVLFERLKPILLRWPLERASWLEALPAESTRLRKEDRIPFPGVSWSETVRIFGWPPKTFIGQQRLREADSLLITVLRWTFERLLTVAQDADATAARVTASVTRQLEITKDLLLSDALSSAEGFRPTQAEISALYREGRPWNLVAPVADELRTIEESLGALAARLLIPDEDLRWRIFHLAVLGEVLVALRNHDARVVSRRPLAAGIRGPAYEIVDARARVWDLWFEAAGAWRYYDIASPYAQAAGGVSGAGSAIGSDIMLIRPSEAALILECKYSWDPSVVARAGYEQALAYAAEAKDRLATRVTSLAIGPETIVERPGTVGMHFGLAGIAPPSYIPELVGHFMEP